MGGTSVSSIAPPKRPAVVALSLGEAELFSELCALSTLGALEGGAPEERQGWVVICGSWAQCRLGSSTGLDACCAASAVQPGLRRTRMPVESWWERVPWCLTRCFSGALQRRMKGQWNGLLSWPNFLNWSVLCPTSKEVDSLWVWV